MTLQNFAKQLIKRSEPKHGGIIVGSEKQGKSFHVWMDTDDTHVLLIGATRSGKSRKVILPSMWTLANFGESMVLADPKGELYHMTSGYLKKKGYDVVVIDLRNPTRGNRWNPLQLVIESLKSLKKADKVKASQTAKQIAHMITYKDQPPEQYRGDPIWPQTQRSMTAALALAIVSDAPHGARHFGSVYKTLIKLGQKGGKSLDSHFSRLPDDHIAKDAYGVASMAEDRLKNSVFTGTAAQLELWSDPGVVWMTAEQDHDLAAPGKNKTAVFIIAPDEDDTIHVLCSLYIMQMYQALIRLAQIHGDKLPVRVNFLLDEFGNMPPIPDFARKLTMAAGRNIRFLLAVQGVDQIAYHYPKLYKTITGNCNTWIYISTADIETAQIISKKTGQYTVKTESYSAQAQLNKNSQSHSVTQGLTGRPLRLPDEILRWPKDQGLILKAGQYPARLPLLDLSLWPAASDFVPLEHIKNPTAVNQPQIWFPSFVRQPKLQVEQNVEPEKELVKQEDKPQSLFD